MTRKPSASMGPTKCSLLEARNRGWQIVDCQFWRPVGGGRYKRADLMGFADHLAIGDGLWWAIQTTTRDNRAARVKKILQSEWALRWIAADNHRIVVWDWGYYTRPVNGKTWRLHETPIGLVEIEEYRDHRDNVDGPG